MKKMVAVLLSLVAFMGLLAGCSTEEKAYVGDFYSKAAKAMNAEAILSIYDDEVFEIEYLYADGSSILIHGTYEEISGKEVSLQPENQIIILNDIPAENDMKDEEPIIATLDGDIMTLGKGEEGEEIFIREGSKAAETDTTVSVETKSE